MTLIRLLNFTKPSQLPFCFKSMIVLMHLFSPLNPDPPVIESFFVRRISRGQRGVDAIFTCLSDGRPPVSVAWLCNDTKVNNGSRRQIHHSLLQEYTLMSSFLIISHISAEDNGNYTCLTKTRLGNDSATITFSYSGNLFTIRPRCIMYKDQLYYYDTSTIIR